MSLKTIKLLIIFIAKNRGLFNFKRYFKIDQHSAWHIEYYGACLSSPTPFLRSQIVTPFFKFNDIHQSVNRVVILAKFGTLLCTLILVLV